MAETLEIRKAEENNLKQINVDIPRDSMVVITGVSGSGKSSLAFDTIFQEGQRKYIESLSAYARQFIGSMKAPLVEKIEGVSPTISIDQKTVNRNPRSTVGTITEILDHFRLLMSRLGKVSCPKCGHKIQAQSVQQITDQLFVEYPGQNIMIMAPIVQARKGEYRKELAELLEEGYVRARIDGEIHRLEEPIQLDRYVKHTIEVVQDRLLLKESNLPRLREALEAVLKKTGSQISLLIDDKIYLEKNTKLACPKGHFSIPEIEPRLFSFNEKQGQCDSCKGIGHIETFMEDLVIPDPTLSINQGCIKPQMAEGHLMFSRYGQQEFEIMAKRYGFSLNTPWNKLKKSNQKILLWGTDEEFAFTLRRRGRRGMKRKQEFRRMRGLMEVLQRVYDKWRIPMMQKYMQTTHCDACNGTRLNAAALSINFYDKNIHELSTMTIDNCLDFFKVFPKTDKESKIGHELFGEINSRLLYLQEVGLGYLSIDRSASTLSGGEAQRIRLASQVGAGLQGVTYVLDEPSIGLHPRDNDRLLNILKRLRKQGNTLIVVEHDEETMRQADVIIDIGPGAGVLGGEILASGDYNKLIKTPASLTGKYLSGKKRIDIPTTRRTSLNESLWVKGATENNLQNIDVEFPLGILCSVTGVSGSGKSTLINSILKKSLAKELHGALAEPGNHKSITGIEYIDKVIEIDQSPIGRTPRSNPATYTKVFDIIRDLFAQLPESKLRGYKKGRFSFNVAGGRCEECDGSGYITIDMQLLADVQLPCEACHGKRFNAQTLEVHYKGKTISDVLELSIAEAVVFFDSQPKILKGLQVLNKIGLGYIKLGQPSTTLSGGEAQRMKIASELRKPEKGHTLYILDEPTTGLHFEDIKTLLSCIQELVDRKNSAIVIEHNLDVVKSSDWVIDLGPEGGSGGGKLLCEGTPEQVAQNDLSITGHFLKKALNPVFEKSIKRNKISKKKQKLDIEIFGAIKHNLKNIDVTIPRHKLTVISGVSGSGKSSLAFHTLFAEGQRRFVESLSTYARRFLGGMDRGNVKAINGLAPAIAIDQASANRSPRSTVATITELYDYFRLLFARIGIPHCPHTNQKLLSYTPSDIYKSIQKQYIGEKLLILAPVYMHTLDLPMLAKSRENLNALRSQLLEQGYLRFWADGKVYNVETDDIPHSQEIYLVIDRISVNGKQKGRVVESIEHALETGHELMAVATSSGTDAQLYSLLPGSSDSRYFLTAELEPKHFSFNSHWGACETCHGFGTYGRRVCPECDGEKLKPQFRKVLVGDLNISKLSNFSIDKAHLFFENLKLNKRDSLIAEQILKEIQGRLAFLTRVGLGYLGLDRVGDTLSGGESQRIRLASQIGSGLQGVLYVLDEPTVGLHQQDTKLLMETLYQLRDLGNTVVVVEHDLDFIQAADHIIEMGPGAGEFGGEVVAAMSPQKLMSKNTLTGRYLSRKDSISSVPSDGVGNTCSWIELSQANFRTLKGFDIKIPMAKVTTVTGVSGTGKSTLIQESLVPLVIKKLTRKGVVDTRMGKLELPPEIAGIHLVDQSPIGGTPRSSPVTYTKLLDKIRDVFAKTTAAKIKGFSKSRFSYNIKEGRCASCEGRGYHNIEMHFLSDVWELCEECNGDRYNTDTLSVKFKGKSIADVLKMTMSEGLLYFDFHASIKKVLQVFVDIGLGYLRLGQAANTLSGGEAQRMKLATELAKATRKPQMFCLDEPTRGLHMEDIKKLWKMLRALAKQGHAVVLIEHQADIIRQSDWIIDLGPVGGELGGELQFMGEVKSLLNTKNNATAQAIRDYCTF